MADLSYRLVEAGECTMLQEAVDEYLVALSTSSNEDERGRINHNTTAAYRNDLTQFCAYLKQH